MANTIDEMIAEAKSFIAERDEVLMSGDLKRLREFHNKHHPDGETIDRLDVLEICLHKCRTGATSLPDHVRIDSYLWLKDRGYTSMDDDGIKALLHVSHTIN